MLAKPITYCSTLDNIRVMTLFLVPCWQISGEKYTRSRAINRNTPLYYNRKKCMHTWRSFGGRWRKSMVQIQWSTDMPWHPRCCNKQSVTITQCNQYPNTYRQSLLSIPEHYDMTHKTTSCMATSQLPNMLRCACSCCTVFWCVMLTVMQVYDSRIKLGKIYPFPKPGPFLSTLSNCGCLQGQSERNLY